MHAFGTLYERYADMLFKAAVSRLKNDEIAKDLVQEVFITLYQKRYDTTHIHDLKNWLYACMRNRVLNEIRNTLLHEQHNSKLQTTGHTAEPVINYDLGVLEKKYVAILESLSTRCREVFVLSRSEHLSNKSIAEKLNISTKAVEKHITSALRVLRRDLISKVKTIFFFL
ncbi:MAG: sigma-70 family RNA polymerase sigma factor [Mucilaginibacter polytrichastri]|nr:sigma-70 family RNA polymerase sigma factor [Mucilaginibacter polytrichastri]